MQDVSGLLDATRRAKAALAMGMTTGAAASAAAAGASVGASASAAAAAASAFANAGLQRAMTLGGGAAAPPAAAAAAAAPAWHSLWSPSPAWTHDVSSTFLLGAFACK